MSENTERRDTIQPQEMAMGQRDAIPSDAEQRSFLTALASDAHTVGVAVASGVATAYTIKKMMGGDGDGKGGGDQG
jgi:hypothetical protein